MFATEEMREAAKNSKGILSNLPIEYQVFLHEFLPGLDRNKTWTNEDVSQEYIDELINSAQDAALYKDEFRSGLGPGEVPTSAVRDNVYDRFVDEDIEKYKDNLDAFDVSKFYDAGTGAGTQNTMGQFRIEREGDKIYATDTYDFDPRWHNMIFPVGGKSSSEIATLPNWHPLKLRSFARKMYQGLEGLYYDKVGGIPEGEPWKGESTFNPLRFLMKHQPGELPEGYVEDWGLGSGYLGAGQRGNNPPEGTYSPPASHVSSLEDFHPRDLSSFGIDRDAYYDWRDDMYETGVIEPTLGGFGRAWAQYFGSRPDDPEDTKQDFKMYLGEYDDLFGR